MNVVDKIHQLNTVFGKSTSTVIPLSTLCDELCEIVGCNIFLFDKKGHIFAHSVYKGYTCPYIFDSLEDKQLPNYYLEQFADKKATNIYEPCPSCTLEDVSKCAFDDRYYSIYPVFSNFEKVAGLLFMRYNDAFTSSDEVLCEYTSAIVTIEMTRQEHEKIHQTAYKAAQAQLAVNSLTNSEKNAVAEILNIVNKENGSAEIFLNAIAAQTYVTHSTVTSALKKLEAAGVIETKSMGVKGKFVQVINDNLTNYASNLTLENKSKFENSSL